MASIARYLTIFNKFIPLLVIMIDDNIEQIEVQVQAKPFLKWAGGKGQLLAQLRPLLPKGLVEGQDYCYVEPFIGGGAMLFFVLELFPNISKVIINDLNPNLSITYRVLRDNVDGLIGYLSEIEKTYRSLSDEERKAYYLKKRDEYNSFTLGEVEQTARLIFLNRTCFNGLYRVNKSGLFNVPFGRYLNPKICDTATLLANNQLLQGVEIMQGDFADTLCDIKHQNVFVYLDPPYRPISSSSSFTSYSQEGFSDDEQVRLRVFCDMIDSRGYQFMLSNSDSLKSNGVSYFDEFYQGYQIDRISASRNINSKGTARGKVTEVLIRNYR